MSWPSEQSRFDPSTVRVVASGLRFPEGPVALEDGTLLIPELSGTLARVAPNGALSRYECGGGVNGAAFGPNGTLHLTNNGGARLIEGEDGFTRTQGGVPGNEAMDGGSVQRLDLSTARVETVLTHVGARHLGWLNDIVFDRSGCCYVVDTTGGALYYFDPGTSSVRAVAEGLAVPNGAGLSPDGSRLYLSETFGDVSVWDVLPGGGLSGRRVLFSDPEAHGWDGLAVDGAGNVCVANLKASGISVISPEGEHLTRFTTPEHDPWVTNLCFGGPDLDVAYVCSSGRGLVYAVPWAWGGLRLNFAA